MKICFSITSFYSFVAGYDERDVFVSEYRVSTNGMNFTRLKRGSFIFQLNTFHYAFSWFPSLRTYKREFSVSSILIEMLEIYSN